MPSHGKINLASSSAAPRDRTPSRASEKSKLGRHGGHPSLKGDLDSGGLQRIAAAEPNKDPTLAACLPTARLILHRPARRRGTGRPPGLRRNQNWDGTEAIP